MIKEIYLAGGMSGLSVEEQNQWRINLTNCLSGFTGQCKYKYCLCNPVEYYNFTEKLHKTEKEVMLFDLDRVRKSNLVIVNFNNPKSLGTMSEIAIAYEYKIPIIGLNSENQELHPWQIEMCTRICNSMEELVRHTVNFYLN